jgi:zinc transporter ZupT
MIVGFNLLLFMDQVLFRDKTHKHSEAIKTPVETVNLQTIDAEGGAAEADDIKVAPIGEKEAEPAEKLMDINVQALVTFGIAICLHSLIDGLAIGVFK